MFGDLYASFLIIILHHPDCCWVMYCYSTFLFHYYYYYYYITPTCGVMYCYSTFLFHYYFSYYITPTVVGWCIAILRFFLTIFTSPRTQSGDVLLFYISFSLLLRRPKRSRVTYCYSTFLFHYYYSSTHFCPLDFLEMPWSNFMKPCRNIICHVKLCW